MYNTDIKSFSMKNSTERSYSRSSSIGIASDYMLPGGSLASPIGSVSKEFRFCAVQHPSVKSNSGKEAAFYDPSKAEADKTCQDYVKDAEELFRKLQQKLQGKPYNQKDLIEGNVILTSMRNEVVMRNVISDLVSHHHQSARKRRVLKLELQETERRANWYHSALEKLISDADTKEKLFKARTYMSYGTLLKISVILQFNLLDKVPYPTERYHSHGTIQVLIYTLLLIFVGLPIQLAVRTISQYSKSLVINSWNFCPFFKGVGWITLFIGGYFMLQSVNTVSIALYMFIDVLRGEVGWSTCPGGENEYCSSKASTYTSINCSDTFHTKIPMIMNSGAAYYYTVVEEAFDLSNRSIELTGLLCIFSIWALVCMFMLLGFETFIKVVEILFIPIIVTALLLLFALQGGDEPMGVGIQNLFNMVSQDADVIKRNMVLFDVLLSLQVVNGVITFLAAHAPQNGNPIVDTYIFGLLDLFIHYVVTIFVFAAAGFLQGYYKAVHCTCFLIYRDITILALIPEFLSRIYMGKYLVILFLVFVILTQIVYIVIVGFTIVKSVTDFIVEGAAHMYAVFVLVATGVAMNFFLHLSNSSDNPLSQKISSGIKLAALFAVAVFVFSLVILYSTSRLCTNITMMIGARPGPVYDSIIKLSLLLYLCVGYSNILYIMKNPAIENWGFVFELFIVLTVPVVFSAMFKIAESSRSNKYLGLFQPHQNWDNNFQLNQKDGDNPQYKQELHCKHKCMRDNVYNVMEENRNASVRRCFQILYPPSESSNRGR